jgi:hypothetical protein
LIASDNVYLLCLSNAIGGDSLWFGLLAVVSKKMPVMFAVEGIVGGGGVGVGRVAPELNLFLVEGDVAWLRRICGDSLG